MIVGSMGSPGYPARYASSPRSATAPSQTDAVELSPRAKQGKALEWTGFAAMMIGGSLVVANSVGALSGGSGVGLALAALGGAAMVGGTYLQREG